MTDSLETWPPTPSPEFPLFALPNVWLFPSLVVPLYIFEPRYREMIEDILDGPGRFVLGTVVSGHESEMAGSPPVHPIAGLGEIGRHERKEDGCFDIYLVGLRRVAIREVESDRPYRMVAAEPAEEIAIPPDDAESVREELVAAIAERTDGKAEFPPDASISMLSDILTLHLHPDHDVTHELFSELDQGRRARRALEIHAASS